ncbi:MAG: hypothetical protein NCW75_14000 [Phycisphaera sp.]|nr:MAG: hypothetical protein NCW75_14000 [Phycisphaera sp.]
MGFWTEYKIERWIERETREISLPDGSTRSCTAFRLVWEQADSLVLLNGFSYAELAGYADEEARLQNLGFDEAFSGIVAWLDGRRRERWGI